MRLRSTRWGAIPFAAGAVVLVAALLAPALATRALADPHDPLGKAFGLRVGAPRQGDVAAYEVASPAESDEPRQVVLFWNGTAERATAWGPRARHDLLEVHPAFERVAYGYPPGGLAPAFAESTFHGHAWSEPEGDGTRTVTMRQSESIDVRYEVATDLRHCLARSAWQGASFGDLDGLDARELCPGGVFEGRLRHEGVETLGGVAAVRYALGVAGGGEARVWLAPRLAYPLRLVVESGSLPPESGMATPVTFDLVGFEPGGGEPLPLRASQAEAPPARGRVPWGAFGPPDDGAGLASSLQETFDALMEHGQIQPHSDPHWGVEIHPNETTFAEWMRARPDAHLSMATWHGPSSSCMEDGHRSLGGWGLRYRDGSEALFGGASVVVPCDISADGERGPAPGVETRRFWTSAVPEPGGGTFRNGSWPTEGLGVAEALRAFAHGRVTDDVPANFLMIQMPEVQTPSLTTLEIRHRSTIEVRAGPPLDTDLAEEWMTFDAETGRLLHHRWSVDASSSAFAWTGEERFFPAGLRTHALPELPPIPTRVQWAMSLLGLLLMGAGLAGKWPGFLAFLATRLTPARVEAHPRRAALLMAVREQPGVTHGELRDLVGLSPGVASYHLGVLLRGRRLRRMHAAGFTHYYPAGHPGGGAAAPSLPADAPTRVLRAVQEMPGVHAAALARRFGVSEAAISHAVRQLEQEGRLRREPRGRRQLLFAVRDAE